VSIKTPQLPRISPQSYQQNTTFCTTISAKPPAKTPFSRAKNNLQLSSRKTGLPLVKNDK
jgi:hypothetical protein